MHTHTHMERQVKYILQLAKEGGFANKRVDSAERVWELHPVYFGLPLQRAGLVGSLHSQLCELLNRASEDQKGSDGHVTWSVEFWRGGSSREDVLELASNRLLKQQKQMLLLVDDLRHAFLDGVLDLKAPLSFLSITRVAELGPACVRHTHSSHGMKPLFEAYERALAGGVLSSGPRAALSERLDAIMACTSTPALDVILDTQDFPRHVRALLLALLGRLLHPCGADRFATLPLLSGMGATGKSSILNLVQGWFEGGLVASLLKLEEARDVVLLAKARAWQLSEFGPEFVVEDATTLWRAVRGEAVLPGRGRKVSRVPEGHGIAASNNFPVGVVQPGLDAWKHMTVFLFPMFPHVVDPSVEENLLLESSEVLLKAAGVYEHVRAHVAREHGGSFQLFLTEYDVDGYFSGTRLAMYEAANPVTAAFCRCVRRDQLRTRKGGLCGSTVVAPKNARMDMGELLNIIGDTLLDMLGDDAPCVSQAGLRDVIELFGLRVCRGGMYVEGVCVS